jgi:hypothetical protein
MGVITQFIFNYVYLYFCIPAFLLMLFGRPRFLVKAIRKVFEISVPRVRLSIGTVLMGFCMMNVLLSYYKKHVTDEVLSNLILTVDTEGIYNERIREAHLYERNCFMYFTFTIMILVLQRMCGSYDKLWVAQDEYNHLHAFYKDATK